MRQISYEDKITKNVSTEEDVYKVTADNLSEIKEVVNENADESERTTETINTEEEIEENTDYEIPLYYKVGADVLDVYYEETKLVKDVHYVEVGSTGDISNIIQFYDWGQSVPSGSVLEFVARGTWEGSE